MNGYLLLNRLVIVASTLIFLPPVAHTQPAGVLLKLKRVAANGASGLPHYFYDISDGSICIGERRMEDGSTRLIVYHPDQKVNGRRLRTGGGGIPPNVGSYSTLRGIDGVEAVGAINNGRSFYSPLVVKNVLANPIESTYVELQTGGRGGLLWDTDGTYQVGFRFSGSQGTGDRVAAIWQEGANGDQARWAASDSALWPSELYAVSHGTLRRAVGYYTRSGKRVPFWMNANGTTMRDLPLGGFANGEAWGVNNSGTVCGRIWSSTSAYRACIWRWNGSSYLNPEILTQLDGGNGSPEEIAFDISEDGHVSGRSNNGGERGVAWFGSAVQDLNVAPWFGEGTGYLGTMTQVRGISDIANFGVCGFGDYFGRRDAIIGKDPRTTGTVNIIRPGGVEIPHWTNANPLESFEGIVRLTYEKSGTNEVLESEIYEDLQPDVIARHFNSLGGVEEYHLGKAFIDGDEGDPNSAQGAASSSSFFATVPGDSYGKTFQLIAFIPGYQANPSAGFITVDKLGTSISNIDKALDIRGRLESTNLLAARLLDSLGRLVPDSELVYSGLPGVVGSVSRPTNVNGFANLFYTPSVDVGTGQKFFNVNFFPSNAIRYKPSSETGAITLERARTQAEIQINSSITPGMPWSAKVKVTYPESGRAGSGASTTLDAFGMTMGPKSTDPDGFATFQGTVPSDATGEYVIRARVLQDSVREASQEVQASVTVGRILAFNADSLTTYELVILSQPLTYTEANKATLGLRFGEKRGHLVTVNNAAEAEFLRNCGFGARLIGVPGQLAWMGSKRSVGKEYWSWTTGESFNAPDWASGEPNEIHGSSDLAGAMGTNGRMFDTPADKAYLAYIVEYDGITGIFEDRFGVKFQVRQAIENWLEAFARKPVNSEFTNFHLATFEKAETRTDLQNLFGPFDATAVGLARADFTSGVSGTWKWITGGIADLGSDSPFLTRDPARPFAVLTPTGSMRAMPGTDEVLEAIYEYDAIRVPAVELQTIVGGSLRGRDRGTIDSVAGDGSPLNSMAVWIPTNGNLVLPEIMFSGADFVAPKTSHSLRTLLTKEVVTGGILTLGDCTGDNYVGTDDYLLVSTSFDSSEGDVDYSEAADLDGDGYVGGDDYLILTQAWDMEGE